jgi:DnaK suppressor protein
VADDEAERSAAPAVLRRTLLDERERALRSAESLRGDLAGVMAASESSNADDEHDPEGATIGFERAQLSALLDSARRRVTDLDLALTRLEHGAYGVCESCGRPIAAERLAALPASRACVNCAAAAKGNARATG